jgi:hypothetical protein
VRDHRLQPRHHDPGRVVTLVDASIARARQEERLRVHGQAGLATSMKEWLGISPVAATA